MATDIISYIGNTIADFTVAQLATGRCFYRTDVNNGGVDNWAKAAGRGGDLAGESRREIGRVVVAELSGNQQIYNAPLTQTWTAKDSARNWRGIAISGDGWQMTAVAEGPGYLYISVDRGETWTQKGTAREWLYCAMSKDGKYRTAVSRTITADNAIFYSSDYGETWTAADDTARNYFAIAMSATGQYQVVTEETATTGLVYESNDYGVTWAVMDFLPGTWRGVALSDTGSCLTISEVTSGKLYVINDLGHYEITLDMPVNAQRIAMSASGQYQLAVARWAPDPVLGKVYTSDDFGETWTARIDSTGRAWSGAAVSTDGSIMYAAVYGGHIWRSENFGVTWTDEGGTNRDWQGLASSWSATVNVGIVYGSTIFREYRDASRQNADCYFKLEPDPDVDWRERNSTTGWRGLVVSGSGKYITTVQQYSYDQIHVSSDYGVTWSLKGPSRYRWLACAMSRDGKYQTAVSAADGSNSIWYSSDYGQTWTAAASTQKDWYHVAVSGDGRCQAASTEDSNQLYVSVDYGVTWTAKATALFWRGIAISFTGDYMLAGGGATIPDGKLWLSLDYGTTWNYVTDVLTQGNNFERVAISDSGRVMLAAASGFQRTLPSDTPTTNAFAYVSLDYGTTWARKLDDTHRAWEGAAMSDDGSKMFLAEEGGNFWTSLTAGASWSMEAGASKRWQAIAVSAKALMLVAIVFDGYVLIKGPYLRFAVDKDATGGRGLDIYATDYTRVINCDVYNGREPVELYSGMAGIWVQRSNKVTLVNPRIYDLGPVDPLNPLHGVATGGIHISGNTGGAEDAVAECVVINPVIYAIRGKDMGHGLIIQGTSHVIFAASVYDISRSGDTDVPPVTYAVGIVMTGANNILKNCLSLFNPTVPPTITVQPASQSKYVGETATFSITAPAATQYQWFKDDVLIEDANSSSYTTPVLEIGDDGATWQCLASNSGGYIISDDAVLTVTVFSRDERYDSLTPGYDPGASALIFTPVDGESGTITLDGGALAWYNTTFYAISDSVIDRRENIGVGPETFPTLPVVWNYSRVGSVVTVTPVTSEPSGNYTHIYSSGTEIRITCGLAEWVPYPDTPYVDGTHIAPWTHPPSTELEILISDHHANYPFGLPQLHVEGSL